MRSLSQRDPPIPSLYVKSLGKDPGTEAISSIFKKARENSPCLLVLEDIDSIVTEHTKSTFLNELDGLQDNDGIMLIASTNYRTWQYSTFLKSENANRSPGPKWTS